MNMETITCTRQAELVECGRGTRTRGRDGGMQTIDVAKDTRNGYGVLQVVNGGWEGVRSARRQSARKRDASRGAGRGAGLRPQTEVKKCTLASEGLKRGAQIAGC